MDVLIDLCASVFTEIMRRLDLLKSGGEYFADNLEYQSSWTEIQEELITPLDDTERIASKGWFFFVFFFGEGRGEKSMKLGC